MKNRKLMNVILTALFAAMILVMTNFIKIPTAGGGYVHLGDAFIYLAACFLPAPLAMLAGAVGGAMADFVGGYAHYMIPTFIIKALIAIPFTNKSERILTKRNGLVTILSGGITVLGYYITKVVMLAMAQGTMTDFTSQMLNPATWGTALANIPENTVQAVGSAILFFVFALALDKGKVKSRLYRE